MAADSAVKKKKKRRKGAPIPEKIGKYLITDMVGEGGMGRVYRGIDPDNRQPVAVKTILEERLTSPAALPRFLREMQILAGLDHPHIVRILDRGMCEGGHFLVMDYVPGKPLDEVIRAGELPERPAVYEWGRQIGEALGYMHSQGVMHRDLKPGNIIRREDGRLTIIDFGLSRFLEPGGTVTGVGRVIGSPHYLPPEQWRGERPDARADVYQVGILFLEILTGKVPFSGTDLRAIMDSCVNYGITLDLLADMGLEGPIAEVVCRATARAREERYQDMETFLRDLAAAREGRPLEPLPDPPTVVDADLPSFSFSQSAEVDLDAPTSVEPPPAVDPRVAASFYAPGGARKALDDAAKRPPTPRGPAVPARPLRPRAATAAPSPAIPPAVWASLTVVVLLTTGLMWVATRPAPPPPAVRLLDGPRVVDGVAAARIEWETDRPTLGRVEVVGGGKAHVAHDEDGVRRDHAVTLVDLVPGERYKIRVLGPDGPLGPAVPFTARGVSISFEPRFSQRGLELHWKSEDPLVLGPEDPRASKPARPRGEFPQREGSLTLTGIRPGHGAVTVLAFAPLGSIMPVVWTVPNAENLAGGVEEILDLLTTGAERARFRKALAEEGPYEAADLLERRAEEAARPLRIEHVLEQASLVLDDPNLSLARRANMLAGLGRLRLMQRELEVRGVDPPLALNMAIGAIFRWGSRAGQRPRGTLLAEWDPPPQPLRALSRDQGAAAQGTLTWTPSVSLDGKRGAVTLVVHAFGLMPGLFLRAQVGDLTGLVLMNDPDIYQLETLDGGEGWSTLYHSFDVSMLKGRDSIRVTLHSLVPGFEDRAVAIRRVELVAGAFEG